MTNRNKDKGTKAETAVVKVARSMYWPNCERRALGGGEGSNDRGDLAGIINVTVQVKSVQAQGPAAVASFREATLTQMKNNNDDIGILVMKPKGVSEKNAHLWETHIQVGQYTRHGLEFSKRVSESWSRFTLEDAFEMIHELGY